MGSRPYRQPCTGVTPIQISSGPLIGISGARTRLQECLLAATTDQPPWICQGGVVHLPCFNDRKYFIPTYIEVTCRTRSLRNGSSGHVQALCWPSRNRWQGPDQKCVPCTYHPPSIDMGCLASLGWAKPRDNLSNSRLGGPHLHYWKAYAEDNAATEAKLAVRSLCGM